MLDILGSYHRIQSEGKRMIQTQGNSKKTHFGPDLAHWVQIQATIFFYKTSS